MHCTRLDRIAFLAVAALLVLAGSAFFALRADGGTRAAPSHDRPLEAAVPPRADEMPEPMALADEMRGSAHGADDMRGPTIGAGDKSASIPRTDEVQGPTLRAPVHAGEKSQPTPRAGAMREATPRDDEMHTPRTRAVEIRTYTLAPGTGAEFHRLVIERSIPLLERFGVDVVAYGPSLHDPDSYILIRAFDSVAARQAADEAFYSSDAWRSGPRDEILARIVSYSTVVVELDEATVDGLRAMGGGAERNAAR